MLLRDRRLSLFDDAELLDEFANVSLRETSPGVLRMDHDPDRHDNRAIALSLAALALVENPVLRSGRDSLHRHGADTAPPRRERRRRLQPAHRGSVGTREEPTVTVVHVAAEARLEPGTFTRYGIRWRPVIRPSSYVRPRCRPKVVGSNPASPGTFGPEPDEPETRARPAQGTRRWAAGAASAQLGRRAGHGTPVRRRVGSSEADAPRGSKRIRYVLVENPRNRACGERYGGHLRLAMPNDTASQGEREP